MAYFSLASRMIDKIIHAFKFKKKMSLKLWTFNLFIANCWQIPGIREAKSLTINTILWPLET